MTTEQRLDSIERVLAATAATLQSVATLTERNTTAIDRLEAQITQTATLTERNSLAINRLEAQVAKTTKSLEDSCADLVRMINHSIEEGERDRQALIETANADRAEIRRILDYLFGQQGNGNGAGHE